MIRLHTEKLRHNQESTWLIIDVIMLVLLVVNLAWLIFDWLFSAAGFASLVAQISPGFHAFYGEQVHPNFFRYDLIFVSVFLTEFCVRWVVSIRRHTYERWFWYPFLHWYELLGCIPLTGFRMLRLLRIISMIYRLQKLGVIDLAETRAGKFLWHHYQVLVEEISDRVVLNVLNGMQSEIRHGSPVGRSILNEVVLPRKDMMVDGLSAHVAELIEHNYNKHRDDIRKYVNAIIADAVDNSDDIKRVERIPLLGNYAIETLERAVGDIVFNVINRAADDLHSGENRQLIQDILDAAFGLLLEEHETLDQVSTDILVDVIEVIKARVRQNRAAEQSLYPPPTEST